MILDVVYNRFGPHDDFFRAFSDRYCSGRYTDRLGQGAELRRGGHRTGPGVLSRQCGLLDQRIPRGRSGYGRHAEHLRCFRRPHLNGIARIDASRRRGTRDAAGRRERGAAQPEAGPRPGPGRLRPGTPPCWKRQLSIASPEVDAGAGITKASCSDYLRHPAGVRSSRSSTVISTKGSGAGGRRKSTWLTQFWPADRRHLCSYIQNHDQIANSARGLRCHAMSEACIGTISEIFDAKPPYTPRGCVAQAWSVAEVLPRVKTAPLDPAVTMDEAEALSMPFASDRAPVPGHLFGQRGCLPPSQGTSVFDVVSQFSHPTLFGSPATLHVSSSPDGLPLLGGRQDQVRRQAYGFTQNRQDARLVYLTDLL